MFVRRVLGDVALKGNTNVCKKKPFVVSEGAACNLMNLPPVMPLRQKSCFVGNECVDLKGAIAGSAVSIWIRSF